ncbi:hypothetical protein XENORESO_003292 [Xenotaenia resolanae]|uniref:Uncharacterized protein n=1 Tax=Xenotaenia resolanae TaxID=208358 RepID=A0ABV0VKV3_9TELE
MKEGSSRYTPSFKHRPCNSYCDPSSFLIHARTSTSGNTHGSHFQVCEKELIHLNDHGHVPPAYDPPPTSFTCKKEITIHKTLPTVDFCSNNPTNALPSHTAKQHSCLLKLHCNATRVLHQTIQIDENKSKK